MLAYETFIKTIVNRYSPVSNESVKLLGAISSMQHLKKGELLLDVGKTSKDIYILYKGIVVSYFLNNSGDMYHKNIFLENDFVGSTVSALKEEPSEFALEVIEDAILIRFNYKKYKELINQHAELKNFYIAYLEKNWVINKEKREVNMVLKKANERYLEFIADHPRIETRVPLRYIASHLGITPTQLSRIRKKMKKNDSNQHM